MVYAAVSKTAPRKGLWVRVPPPAPPTNPLDFGVCSDVCLLSVISSTAPHRRFDANLDANAHNRQRTSMNILCPQSGFISASANNGARRRTEPCGLKIHYHPRSDSVMLDSNTDNNRGGHLCTRVNKGPYRDDFYWAVLDEHGLDKRAIVNPVCATGKTDSGSLLVIPSLCHLRRKNAFSSMSLLSSLQHIPS